MKKTLIVNSLDMVKLDNGSHNCVAIFKTTLNFCIRLTGIKLFNDPLTDKWWMKFPVNESNKKKLPFVSFVQKDDYQHLLSCAINEYKRDSDEEKAYVG